MAKKTTSLRLPDGLRDHLAEAALQQDTTVSALIERYTREGLAIDGHPGIVFKPGPSGRRAALAGGPDVWEVVAALRDVRGTEAQRVQAAADQLGLHPRQVTIALAYAADHRDEIEERIAANERALDEAERAHAARAELLGSA
jgi:hypothetical protein